MVGIYKCAEYEQEKLDAVIEKIFLEHGFDKMIRQGMNVALKPNLLAKKKPEEAVTTHPLFIKAVAKKVVSLGANCTICESPPGSYTKNTLESCYTYHALKPLEEMGVKLNDDISSTYVNNKGKVLFHCDMITPIVGADLVINLAKLKTHSFMNLTCAIKNMLGALPGLKKAEIHSLFTSCEDFANAIIDISLTVKNQISIVDGILALEGNGPNNRHT